MRSSYLATLVKYDDVIRQMLRNTPYDYRPTKFGILFLEVAAHRWQFGSDNQVRYAPFRVWHCIRGSFRQKAEGNMSDLPILLDEIRGCRVCEEYLPLGPRPILQVDAASRILIIGQAPGRRVHASGVAWDDASGDRLRTWMGISHDQFYDANRVALVPMGFCYPGTGDSGDLPPRKECAELWHESLMAHLSNIRLTLLIGNYAQKHRLPDAKRVSLTAIVRRWQEFAPAIFPLPHPSPRNNRWLKKNPWFSEELLPALKRKTKSVLKSA